ncbi:hypothetical protein P154DRAFT_255486 [Amniculicola lignicola CBS 123094]|uniref:Uncharacterized protein n=1 Tax=Amniculicola lignicola CBS 123094 TaxID=1392246 RepID=A0A6A5WWV0_9PLEO|nr:hypothetical protein P154DRAFT_255486 [Amniculicola lignicola CBS 123094]
MYMGGISWAARLVAVASRAGAAMVICVECGNRPQKNENKAEIAAKQAIFWKSYFWPCQGGLGDAVGQVLGPAR